MSPYEIRCYKIWWGEDNPEMYVGSTKQTLCARMTGHRADAKKEKMDKIFRAIRNYGYDFNYVMLESCIVNNTDEQRMREQEWIDKLQPSLNTYRAYTSIEDRNKYLSLYRQTNREEIKRKTRERYTNNKDEINKKARYDYNNTNRDRVLKRQKQRRQERTQTEKEEISRKRKERQSRHPERRAKYYHANKEEIKKKQRERYHAKKLKKLNQETEQEVAVAQ